jgi:hypothetical protein
MLSRPAIVSALAVACVWFINAGSIAEAYQAYQIEGLRPSGDPSVQNPVQVKIKDGQLKADGHGAFDVIYGATSPQGATTLQGGGADYELRAYFNPDNTFDTGTVALWGALKDDGILEKTLLYQADLTAGLWGGTSGQDDLIGFNTTNIYCDPGLQALLPVPCTNSESVYLVLTDTYGPGKPFDGDFNTHAAFTSKAMAISTLPEPIALVLVGSLVPVLGWLRRRARMA